MKTRPRVIIVGGGFGGLAAARSLAKLPVEVLLLDKVNHHLFQPLLYQVATAGLSPADIAAPLRSLLRSFENVEVRLGEVTEVDPSRNQICIYGQTLAYDYLVLATGSTHSYFQRPEWEIVAPGLKTANDALTLRSRILCAFERAELAESHEQETTDLTFVIVGGGPTGVELAGAISELAKRTLVRDFKHIRPDQAKIILLEAGPSIMQAFAQPLPSKARTLLEQLEVEVSEGERVTGLAPGEVITNKRTISAGTILWAAGIMIPNVANWLKAAGDVQGRVAVNDDLSIPSHPNVFVIGDAALLEDGLGNPLPALAPVASQQGAHLKKVLAARLIQMQAPPFHYRDRGKMGTIGRRRAIAQFGKIRTAGWLAWVLWLFVHILQLATFRSRLLVFVQWLWAYVTWQRGARLIMPSRGK